MTKNYIKIKKNKLYDFIQNDENKTFFEIQFGNNNNNFMIDID